MISLLQRPLPTQHKTHRRRTSVPSSMFEPAIPAMEQTQTYALYRMVTGITNSQKWLALGRTNGVWLHETKNDFSYWHYMQAVLWTNSEGRVRSTKKSAGTWRWLFTFISSKALLRLWSLVSLSPIPFEFGQLLWLLLSVTNSLYSLSSNFSHCSCFTLFFAPCSQ